MKVLWVLYFLCASALSCLALDREAFTFTRYNLDLRVELDQRRLGVRGKITLRNESSSPQKNAVLQITSSLSWRSIQADGKAAQYVTHPYESDIDHTGELSEAVVTLPREVAPKGEIELEIGYEGVIAPDATRLTRMGVSKEVAAHADWDQISPSFTAVRGVGYVAWYPVAMEAVSLSEGESLPEKLAGWKRRENAADLDTTLCVLKTDLPEGLIIMNDSARLNGHGYSSGGGVGTGDGKPEAWYCRGVRFNPIGTTVPSFVIGNLTSLNQVGLEAYFQLGHRGEAQDYLNAANAVMPLVKDWFGPLHLEPKIVELPDPQAIPFESGGTLLTPLDSRDFKLVQLVMVHQLTHASVESARTWISEGLATFAQALQREAQDGKKAALQFLTAGLTVMVDGAASDKTGHSHAALIDDVDDPTSRSKAAYVWWMLRDMVGDEALKKALASYHEEQDKDPAYVQRLVQAQSKRDLNWFFDDWVYHDRGLPDFRVSSVYPTKTGQGYLVTVTVENAGASGAEVPVTLKFDGGQTMQRLEVRGKTSASVRFNVPGAPQEVTVNDGSVPESDTSNNVYTVGAPVPNP